MNSREEKSAPQEQGAEHMTFGELISKYGHNQETLSAALGVNADAVRSWIDGSEIPDAMNAMLIGTVLGCSLKTVYLAILRTEKS